MINLAIISPSQNALSETFIKAHREKLTGNISYLFGGSMPYQSEDKILDEANRRFTFIKLLPLFLYYKYKRSTSEKALMYYLKKKKINVVLAEYGPTGAAVFPLCKKLSIPLIVHFHGFDASKKDILEALKDRYTKMFSYASFIIAVSKSMEKRLLFLGAPSNKIVLNTYSPDEIFLSIQPNYATGYFLTLGRFVEKKAPYLTILAFIEFQKKYPQAKLVMLGDGPLLPICKQMIESLEIKNIELAGSIDHKMLPEYFQNACCFLQHSIIAHDGDAEGTPVAILEAGASGLPVIATRHEGISDIIISGKTGFLVEEGNIKSMAKYMEDIFINEPMRRQMGEKAKAHILQNFSLKKHIQKIDELVLSALKKSN